MKFKLSHKLLGGLFALGLAPLSEAALITYTFTGSSADLGSSETYTSGGLSITAYGYSWLSYGSSLTAQDLYRTSSGLGVNNTQDASTAIDNEGSYDLLVFNIPAISGPVQVTFGDLQSNDNWLIGWSSSTGVLNTSSPTALFNSIGSANTASGSGNSYTFTVFDPTINWLFLGGASRTSSGTQNDDFYVKNLSIRTVSEPSTLVMLGAGLLGLGLLRHRRAA